MEKDGSGTAVESCRSSTYTFEDDIKHSFSLERTISIRSFETFQSTYSTSPSLVLLFSWTGAQQRHISKYISGYAKLFPTSPVLVIETSLKDLVMRSSAEKQRNLQRTIDLMIKSGLSNGNILIHCFSDGGSNKAVEFAEAYHARIGHKLPCQALCLDSTPRVYLFSEKDDMIYWRDVERHGVEAARNGVRTMLVRFRNSGHCNHVKEDEKKYWGAMREVWEMRDLEIGVAL
ncbi:hypothetical protein NA56DRAFT_575642 [Hyaloscypha hepaticicola]|uniref:DUF829-domain-containing protein n=1 Tax=Hyaloscypha hepaticicola TaxID=2082293 RepID=A0A2J6PZL1_9HELO|nr:hypothetical protein NA56DRAFT_575642 [Hyaloscypha hepaticicola]